jgi:hypothetical protein
MIFCSMALMSCFVACRVRLYLPCNLHALHIVQLEPEALVPVEGLQLGLRT